MTPTLLWLSLACLVFVGTHFLLSHPLRSPLINGVGKFFFLGIYSTVAVLTLAWVSHAFRAAPDADLPGSGPVGWALASVLTLVALVLFLGSLIGNPAFPTPGAPPAIPSAPQGVFRITRHPMMWGIALWALAHIIVFWSIRTLIVAVAIGFLALVGAYLQDRKKLRERGEAWAQWETATSYWPRFGYLFSAGIGVWLLAVVAWLAITYAHLGAGVPAGIWRWVL